MNWNEPVNVTKWFKELFLVPWAFLLSVFDKIKQRELRKLEDKERERRRLEAVKSELWEEVKRLGLLDEARELLNAPHHERRKILAEWKKKARGVPPGQRKRMSLDDLRSLLSRRPSPPLPPPNRKCR